MSFHPQSVRPDPTQLEQAASDVFVGDVVAVGPSPGRWSAERPSFQRVTWHVASVIKGNVPGRLDVSHPVVARSVTAAPVRPGLDEEALAPGRRHVVYVNRQDGHWHAVSEAAVVPADGPASL